MSPGAKILLAVAGVVGGGLLANAVLAPVPRVLTNPFLRPSTRGVSVGGTHDWWLGRNERRRKKHHRMMTAKG
jgi:hypothetical protein